jgi:hypothetical protein
MTKKQHISSKIAPLMYSKSAMQLFEILKPKNKIDVKCFEERNTSKSLSAKVSIFDVHFLALCL